MSDAARPDKLLIAACESDALDPLHAAFEQVGANSKNDKLKDEAIAELINSTTNPVGVPALHVAVRHGSLEVIEELFEYPLRVDLLDKHKNSIVHQALVYSENGEFDIATSMLELFLEAGTPLGTKNEAGFTPRQLLKNMMDRHISDIIRRLNLPISTSQSNDDLIDDLSRLQDTDLSAADSEEVDRIIGWKDLAFEFQRHEFQRHGGLAADADDANGASDSE